MPAGSGLATYFSESYMYMQFSGLPTYTVHVYFSESYRSQSGLPINMYIFSDSYVQSSSYYARYKKNPQKQYTFFQIAFIFVHICYICLSRF
jgi:hypothetical protein